jgi:glycosyltransferase involved in cell wall biosynthesis
MLCSLKRSGWGTAVVAWDRYGNTEVPVQDRDLVDDWHWVRMRAPIWGGLNLLTRLPLYYYYLLKFTSRVKKTDLWIVCHFWLLGSVFFLSGKKIYDAPEMYAIDWSTRIPALQSIIKPAVSFLEGFLISRVDGVLTVDSRGDWLERFYRRWNQNVQVVWNVPAKLDDPDLGEVRALSKEYLGKKVVAFIGGLKSEKGFRVAIQAAAIVKETHPNVLFLFIGSMQDDGENVNNLIQAKNLKKNISLLQWMPYRKMLAHLHHAKIGLGLHQRVAIYPFVSAGNGRKFFTYMQAGIPVIGPDFGEVGLVVKMADCGLLVDTENVDKVSEAIIELLEIPEKAESMGEKGRQAFLECFNWEKEEQKFLTFVELNTTRRVS